MKRLILLCSLALLALASSAQTTGTWNKVTARDTFVLSGRQLAEIVYAITSAARNNESPTAKAVYDYVISQKTFRRVITNGDADHTVSAYRGGTTGYRTEDTTGVLNVKTRTGKTAQVTTADTSGNGTTFLSLKPPVFGNAGLVHLQPFNFYAQRFVGVNLPFSTRPNYVFGAGYNLATNGTRINSHEPAAGFSIETYYQSASLGGGGATGVTEFHLFQIDTNGTVNRFLSAVDPVDGRRWAAQMTLKTDFLAFADRANSNVWQHNPFTNIWDFSDTTGFRFNEARGFALSVLNGASSAYLNVIDFNNTDTLEIARQNIPNTKINSMLTLNNGQVYAGGASSGIVKIGSNTAVTQLNVFGNTSVGSSSLGARLFVYNDYSSSSAAGSDAWAVMHLRNRNNTNNNWSAIQFNSSAGTIAADIAAQYVNQASHFADIVFHTRGSTTSFGEAGRITSEKELLMGSASSGARIASRGKGATSSTYSGIFENSSGADVLVIRDDIRVGIGVTAPANTLDVEGTIAIGAAYSGTSAATTNGAIIEGSVGIGNNSPGTKLHTTAATGTTTPILRIENTGGDADFFVANATPEGAITGSPGDIALRTDSGNGKIYVKGSGTGNTGWLDVSAGGGVTDHGALTGLGDDDHTQYFLLAGRSGGQIGTGGTGSGDDLTLRSTTNATKGEVKVQDQGGHMELGGGELASELRWLEPAGSGTNYTALKTAAQSTDQTYTWPTDAPANGDVWTWHTSGLTSWDAPTQYAPLDAGYILISNDATLPNDRALSSGLNNVRVDAGAGSTVSLDVLGGVSNISQFTSDQDNYTNSDWSTRTTHTVSSDNGMRAMTGFAALTEGTIRRLINTGTFPMYVPAEHPDSDAANRVAGTGDQIIAPNGGVLEITYVGSRWRVTGNDFNETNLGFKYKGQFYNQVPGSTNQSDHPYIGLTTAGAGAGNQNNPPDDSPNLPQSWGLLTGTTSTGSQTVFFPKNNNAFAAFGGGHLAAFGQIYVPTLSSGTQRYTAQISLTPSANGSTLAVNSSVGIRYSDNVNGGEWEVFTRNSGGTETTGDSNIAVAANTVYNCAIYVDKGCTEARFFITDGTNNYVTRIAATMPATTALAGVRVIAIASVGTTSKQVAVANIGGYFIQP